MDKPTQKTTFDELQGPSTSKRIRPSGGYRRLRSFQAATVIYDTTVSFCARFLDQRSRTVDQMVQAARSGRQNPARVTGGSRASATSTQTELRLVNVARASLDELLLDFEDFLRQDGGYSERLAAARIEERRRQDQADRSDPTDRSKKKLPPCPLCGKTPGGAYRPQG